MTTEQRTIYIQERWGQLNSLILATIDNGIKYLFAVSGGGCVAVLAFIGTNTQASKTWLGITLGLFFIALLLVGLLSVLRFRYINKILEHWISASKSYFDEKTSFTDMCKKDDKLVKESEWIALLGYASYTFIVLAGITGFLSFFCYSNN